MPIEARIRKQFYGKPWREVVRPRILARAGNKCEQCGKPNGARVFTYTWREPSGPRMIWIREGSRVWRNQWGRAISLLRPRGLPRKILVDLQICHLNNCPGDDRDDNLRACCGWCHCNLDLPFHKQTRAGRKDGARPLLAGLHEAHLQAVRTP